MMWWGMLDGTSMLHDRAIFLISLVLCGIKVSLTMTPFEYFADSVVDLTTLTFLDSGSVPIVTLTGVGQCVVTATGVERLVRILLLLLLLGMLVVLGVVAKALWVGILLLDPVVCRPRHENHVSCLHVVRRGLGVGTPPRNADSDVPPGELLGALKLLQTVMSAEDFSKYEKLVAPPSKEERTKEREQLLWEKVQSQNRLRKQEAGHVEQIAKLEADAAKQRAMLGSVREQLEAVNDEVCPLAGPGCGSVCAHWSYSGASAAPSAAYSSSAITGSARHCYTS